jgi:hypothetical protein
LYSNYETITDKRGVDFSIKLFQEQKKWQKSKIKKS